LDLKVLEYFDFYPTPQGFKGMKVRKEFEHGSNEDFISALFYVLQQTGRQALSPLIQNSLDFDASLENRSLIPKLLPDLEAGRPITARYSTAHTSLSYANFRAADIE